MVLGNLPKTIRSYLTNRTHYVQIKNFCSLLKKVSTGVPQGSALVLESLFFIIYINDLPNCLNSPPKLFADDICLLYSNNNLHLLEQQSNDELT